MKNHCTKLFILIALAIAYCQFSTAQTNYYISKSPTASDNNTGLDSAHAWKSGIVSKKVNAVYNFRCGDEFYTRIGGNGFATSATATVTIKSFGTGAKPVFNQYSKIKSTSWVAYAANIWRVDLSIANNITQFIPALTDCGNVGIIKTDGVIRAAKKSALGSLASQWDFYSDNASFLYVYSTANPSTLATSIEAACDKNGINVNGYFTVKDVAFRGFGGVGINGVSVTNVTISNCDVLEGGGCYLGASGTTRYGEGIAFQEGATNVTVKNNLIKLQYEAGFTMQSHGSSPIAFKNVIYTNNIIDSCESGFNPSIETGNYGYIACSVDHNTFKNCGYSWSHNVRPVDNQATALLSNFWNTTQTDIVFVHNTIYNPREGVAYLGGNFTDPRFVVDSNDVTIKTDVRLRKNFQNGSSPYNYYLADTSAYIAAFGYDKHTKWHVYTTGVTKTYYQDNDGDSHGNSAVHKDSTAQPVGYVVSSDDCNDNDATIHPGAAEVCDGVDNDCDGVVDNGCKIFYHDADADSYGGTDTVIRSVAPVSYVSRTGDCDDADSSVHPGAVEKCDGVDNNCDGNVDEGCATPVISVDKTTYYARANDGKVNITVNLSQPFSQSVSFQYATIDGTAVANTDYIPKSGLVTFPIGSTSTTITISLQKQKGNFSTKYFTFRITQSARATISVSEATVYISR